MAQDWSLDNNFNIRMSAGNEMEGLFSYAMGNAGIKVFPYDKTDIDKKEGTDFTLHDKAKANRKGGLRIDITANFSNKDYMSVILDTGIDAGLGDGQTFKIGIRHGNAHGCNGYTEFENPVVVFGVDASEYQLSRAWDAVECAIRKNASKIDQLTFDAYCDYLETNPKEREYITPVKFKMNENYHEPIGISEEYKKANELQRRRLETAKYLPEQQTANVDMNYNFA